MEFRAAGCVVFSFSLQQKLCHCSNRLILSKISQVHVCCQLIILFLQPKQIVTQCIEPFFSTKYSIVFTLK